MRATIGMAILGAFGLAACGGEPPSEAPPPAPIQRTDLDTLGLVVDSVALADSTTLADSIASALAEAERVTAGGADADAAVAPPADVVPADTMFAPPTDGPQSPGAPVVDQAQPTQGDPGLQPEPQPGLPGQVAPPAPTQADQVPGQVVPPAPGQQQPQALPAQQPQQTRRGEDCELVNYRVFSSVDLGGSRMTEVGLPEFVCADGIRVRADSAVDFEAAGRIQFIGGFRYEDADRILTSVDADYFEAQGRLNARGSVEVLARNGESEIRGDTLNLYEGLDGPADDQLVVSGRPAFALFYPESDPDTEESVADAAEPYELNGTVLRFEGEDFVFADGEAVLVRDSLRGTSDRLMFARRSGVLTMTGNAHLDSEGSVFEGEEIELLLPDDELSAINVSGQGRLRTEDLALDAAEIRIDMVDGEMRHLVAVRRAESPPPPTPVAPGQAPLPEEVPSGPGGVPARAESETFVLVGDSIDVVSEDGVLRTAWAVGSARAVALAAAPEEAPMSPADGAPADDSSGADPAADGVPDDDAIDQTDDLSADTVAVDGPTDGPTGGDAQAGDLTGATTPELDDTGQAALAILLAEDWIEGDTIEVLFAPSPEPRAEDDPAYVLDGLIATGSARSLYRSPPDEVDAEGRPVPRPPREEWAISYMLADRIALTLAEGEVESVESTGSVIGEYLEPIRPAPTPADSTRTVEDQ